MWVGARPWQVVSSEPPPEVDPDLAVPIDVEVLLDYVDMSDPEELLAVPAVRFVFNGIWRKLPIAIQRMATVIALDMAAGNMVQKAFYLDAERPEPEREQFGKRGTARIQKIATAIEKFTQAVLRNPHYRLENYAEASELAETIRESFSDLWPSRHRRLAYFTGTATAAQTAAWPPDWIMVHGEQISMHSSILLALSTLQCHESTGPLAPTSSLWNHWMYDGLYEEPYEPYENEDLYTFLTPEMAIGVRDCMEPWINIWWQEVLDTIAFIRPKGGSRVFR